MLRGDKENTGLQSKILEISQHIEELKKKSLLGPEKATESLAAALKELEVSLEGLSAADETIVQQNEELIKAREALRESDIKYRTIADNTYDWEIWLDPQGKFLYCSPSCERITGYRADEFIANSGLLRTILHPDDRAIFEDHFREVGQDLSHKQEIELRIVRPDGTSRWLGHICQPVFDSEGRFLGARGSNRDITERKQAEDALLEVKDHLEIRIKERTAELEQALTQLEEEISDRKEAEATVKAERQRFNDVLETLPAYLVLLTPDYHVPFANRFFRERFGEAHGRRCFEYLFGRNEPCEICETYTVLKTNKPHRWEWTGPDGRNYDIYDFPFKDVDGSPLIMEMGIDITNRKRFEKDLMQSQRSLAKAQRIAHVGSWELDLAKNEVQWSEEVFRIYGWPTRDGAPIPLTETLGANFLEDQEIVDAAFKETLRTGSPLDVQHRIRRPDGSVRWIHCHAELIADPDGKPSRIVGSALDITEAKLSEETMRIRALQQEVVAKLGLNALSGSDPAELMDEAVVRLGKTLDVEYAKVLKLMPDSRELLLVAGVGWQNGLVGRGTVGAGLDSQAGYTLLSSEPVIVENLKTETRFSGPPLLHEHGVVSGMSTIISGHGRPFGVLGVHTTRHRKFTADNVHFLQAVANLIAMAIEQKRVEAELETHREHLEELVQDRTSELEEVNEELQSEITERKRAEDILQTNLQRFYTVLSSMYAGILLVTDKGLVEFANQAFCDIFDLKDSPNDLVGLTSGKVIEKIKNSYLLPKEAIARITEILNLRQPVKGEEVAMQGERTFMRDFIPLYIDGKSYGRLWHHLDITERKRSEKALARERANLQTIFEAVNVGMMLIDESGAVRRINDAVTNLVGKKEPSEWRGQQPGDILGCVHAINDPAGCGHTPYCALCPIRNAFGTALRFGKPVHGVEAVATLLVGKEEVSLWFDVSVDPLVLDGNRSAIIAISDITRRKGEEDQLHKLNRTLRALSNSNQALMRATDEPAYLEDVCKIIVEDCGHEMVWIGYAEEDEAKSVRPVAYAGFEEGYLEALDITWEDTERGRGPTGTAVRTANYCACRNMLTDPRLKPWREEAISHGYASSIALPLISGEKVIGIVNIYSRLPDPFSEDEIKLLMELAGDIAYGITTLRLRKAHAQAEEGLRETKDYLENLIDYANAPIIVWDTSFRITRFNHAFERLTGLKAEEVLAEPLEVLFPEDSKEVSLKHIKRALSGEHWEIVEIPILKTDGSIRTVLWNSASITDKDDRTIAAIAQGHDITERKRAEEEIERLNRDLQCRAAALEAANKELESFSYSVSHDLRAPLRAMDGFSRILLEEYSTKLPPDAKRYLQLVRTGAQQMSRLIDDLLAFSRLGRQTLNKQRVLPIDLVVKVLEELKDDRKDRQIDIVIGDLPACEADPALLKQVFVNLISNALKFARKRENAKIEMGSKERDGIVVYFIKDNGAGFDMKYAHKLFGVFQRLHSAEEYEGTGVGLANVQRIVHRHGGSIWAEGEVDKGATFYFTLEGGS